MSQSPHSPAPLTSPPKDRGKLLAIFAGLLLVQSAYLGSFASPDLFYVGNVFAHFLGGLALTPLFFVFGTRAVRSVRDKSGAAAGIGSLALVAFAVAVATALFLVIQHNNRANRWILNLHIITSCAAALLGLVALAIAGRKSAAFRMVGIGAGIAVILAVAIPIAQKASPDPRDVIRNPDRAPMDMAGEVMGGQEGPFFPSSIATSTGGRIPSDFFMTSESCKRCHSDIYEQWKGSAHHFSSFNNQWYRKSIEYMQSVNSIESSRWCAGCHDHAVVLNGMMDRPISEFIHTQEAHTGLACNSCHAVTEVKGTMGQAGFHIEYPPLHDMAVSENPFLRWMHDFAVQLDPGPHKEVFLKPFHSNQTAEFCAGCHKVHLDAPVNNYRWMRGFNEYDNWQASGVSGEGARSFYYPAQPMDCADCHMPRVPSNDKGNVDGMVHDHSFIAANTALPVANLHEDQLRRTIEFLQKNQVTVDVFAATPAQPLESSGASSPTTGASASNPTLASTFAVGEEAGMGVGGGGGSERELVPVWAPLDRMDATVCRGDDVRIDVVVRTRGVGHFFPGGVVDAHEVWLELRAVDENDRTIYWSGVVEDGGAGRVDPGAHFYKSHPVDAHGNEINKRNMWAARAVAWVNLIPPGAADVAHFRLRVPEDCGNEIRLEARLNYRKFTYENTEFSFVGVPAPGEPEPGPGQTRVTPDYDDRVFVAGEVPRDISAEILETPKLPIVVMHRAEAKLKVAPRGAKVENVSPPPTADEWMRWNDYGIGLFRQDDLQGARRAFSQVVAADANNPEGHVNLARVAVREGLLEPAEKHLGEALALDPELPKAHYFVGLAMKERGRYDDALVHLRKASAAYPRDRVVLNDIGRVLFLKRDFAGAVESLKQVTSIDPEDLMAHYNLMLAYRGLGRNEDALAHQHLYERFKADEDANAILGPYLRENPEQNRMRQLIHEQVSAPADWIAREVALRAQQGEPHTVLPGEGADFAKRVVERGHQLIAEGKGAERHLGPIEAGKVQPARLPVMAKTEESRPGPAAAVAPYSGVPTTK